MHEHGTVHRGGAPFIWKWGAICGAVLGAIQIIISLLFSGSLKTIIDVAVWLVAFFMIGLFAARQTGRVTTGALVGLVAGLLGGLLAVIVASVQVATDGQITQALNKAGQRGGNLSPGELHTIVIVLIVLSLAVTVVLEIGLGAGVGALGGLVGRRLARPVPSTSAVDLQEAPPSPPAPRALARRRFWMFLLNVAFAVLGILVGVVLAIFTAGLLINAQARAMQTTTNGWSISMQCGQVGNGILLQAACAQTLPMVNLPQEAVYWTATEDGAGQTLTGEHDYLLHFPSGDLPPNQVFWSLTMTNPQGQMVANPSNRYSVGDRSGLVPNADGSTDIYIQQAVPAGHVANWLPAPGGDFKLWLRVYQPGAVILSGAYHVPPVVEVH